MGHSLHVMVFALGSAGDVYPFIAIANALQQRGHDVLFVANAHFEPTVTRAGLSFMGDGDAGEYVRVTQDPDLWRIGKAYRVLLKQTLRSMRTTFQIVRDHAIENHTIVVAPGTAWGARLANERLHVPLTTICLQPIGLRSRCAQPGLPVPTWLLTALRPARSLWLAALDRWLLDPVVLPEINAFRTELALPPIRRPFDGWMHSPQLTLGLFPEWYAPRLPDWPPQVRLTGFPLDDEAGMRSLPPEVSDVLAAGEPPIVFTFGTAMRFARRIFEASADACRRLGRRGLLVTEFREQVPDRLPPGVHHVSYAPFSLLLGRAAALVHHGGIGTIAQALRAGIPQLVVPHAFDQPDNARRLLRLGVARSIRPSAYESPRVARALQEMLASPGIADRCRAVAGHFGGNDPIAEACGLIESVATSRVGIVPGR